MRYQLRYIRTLRERSCGPCARDAGQNIIRTLRRYQIAWSGTWACMAGEVLGRARVRGRVPRIGHGTRGGCDFGNRVTGV